MDLSNLIQIPCHHVLANEIDLNLKYRIGLKQFFNINLGIGIIKKATFFFVFSTYIPVFLLKFSARGLVGCGIEFCIQRVPTLHNFDEPCCNKNKKYLKKMWWWCHHHVFSGISCYVINTFLSYFMFLGQWSPSKVCTMDTRWMWNPSRSKFE